MYKKTSLRLSNLYLDLENPRFVEQGSQTEALNTMATEQGEKLLTLLRDIVSHGLNPSDVPIVMPSEGDAKGYVVLEGNRRIASLKLLKRPAILKDERLKAKYSKLNERHRSRVPKTIECLVVDTREEADIWIERKHEGEQNGIGTVMWNTVQKDRYLARKTGKDSKVLQLLDYMRMAAAGDEAFEDELERFSATSLDRLLSSPEVRYELGLGLEKGHFSSYYDSDELMKGLRAVVSRMADKNFKVGDIYHKKDRLNFIRSIPSEEKPDKDKRKEQTWKLKEYRATATNGNVQAKEEDRGDASETQTGQQNNQGTSSQNRPTTRSTFVPRSMKMNIPNERINRLFCELKELSHEDYPNVCAVMFRVFIELSVDCYIEMFQVRDSKKDKVDTHRSLKDKFSDVVDNMTELGQLKAESAKGIKTSFTQDDSIFSANTLNAYVHNNKFNPIPSNLMLSWDNATPFVEALWKAISEKEK